MTKLTSVSNIKESIGAVCLGTFDGVHLGHQAIIAEAVNLSRELGLKSAALTFYPHPSSLTGRGTLGEINDRSQRSALLKKHGIDVVVEHPFTPDFASLSPREFVQDILLEIFGSAIFVAGFNYTFGHKASGTITTLRELGESFGFAVSQVEPVLVDGEVVSSTRVRRLIQSGDLLSVQQCLGRQFSLVGRVLHGDGRGRTLGFPTANVHFSAKQVLPPHGVYLVQSSRYGIGVANLGVRPTFPQENVTLEIHFLCDLSSELYDCEVEVQLLEYLRPERAFSSAEDLKQQVMQDISQAKQMSQVLSQTI